VKWVWLFQSEVPAAGHAAGPPAVPGPLTRRTGPAVPAAGASRAPPPATAPGSRPADARDVKLRSSQRPRCYIAVALACPPPSLDVAGGSPAADTPLVPHPAHRSHRPPARPAAALPPATSMWQPRGWDAPV